MQKMHKIITVVFLVLFWALLSFPALAEEETLGSYGIPLADAVTPANAENAVRAAKIIDGVEQKPGAVFSFNDIVGERRGEKGFVPGKISTVGSAAVYKYGGGICMTASILHQAVKKAGLQVLERHNHVSPVKYLPQGEDAAITWGVQDYKFINTCSNSIMVKSQIINDKLIISIIENKPEVQSKNRADTTVGTKMLNIKEAVISLNFLTNVLLIIV